jgi:excisionase family DNA binding protein
MTKISVNQAAKMLRVSASTIRRMCAKRQLSAEKVGLRTWVIEKSSVEAKKKG